MVSIGFGEVMGWSGLSFTLRGVAPGELHQITRSMIGRSDLHMLQDAPGGLMVVLGEAPLPSLLKDEHVLLIAVQHVTGMWVIRGMRMIGVLCGAQDRKSDAVKYGSEGNALADAQQLAVGSPAGCLVAPKARRKSKNETTVSDWAREMEQRLMASGKLWAVRGDGTMGIGMPQQQFIAGGDFATALSEVAAARLLEVRQELRQVDREITLITPTNRNVSLTAQQHIRESGAAALLGNSSDQSPAVMPLLRTMGFSPYVQGAGAPAQPAPTTGGALPSQPAVVVPLSAFTAGLPGQGAVSPGSCWCEWYSRRVGARAAVTLEDGGAG